jgi:hypothetical protein
MVKAHMRIFYPSKQTVLQSKGGEDVRLLAHTYPSAKLD